MTMTFSWRVLPAWFVSEETYVFVLIITQALPRTHDPSIAQRFKSSFLCA